MKILFINWFKKCPYIILFNGFNDNRVNEFVISQITKLANAELEIGLNKLPPHELLKCFGDIELRLHVIKIFESKN